MKVSKEEIKSCPFCGGEAELSLKRYNGEDRCATNYRHNVAEISCEHCFVTMRYDDCAHIEEAQANAIHCWNGGFKPRIPRMAAYKRLKEENKDLKYKLWKLDQKFEEQRMGLTLALVKISRLACLSGMDELDVEVKGI